MTGRVTRSMLFVPGGRPAMIEKAAGTAADAVCLDLEDSVPPEEKAAARANCVRALRELDFGRRVRMLRINGLETPFAYRDLIEVVEATGDRLDFIMLPKAGRPAERCLRLPVYPGGSKPPRRCRTRRREQRHALEPS